MSNPASQWTPGKRLMGAARTLDPGVGLASLLAVFVVVPLLQPGLPATADTPIHFYRTLELSRSWSPGILFPRWAPDFAYGYGLPFWNFTPPLPYVLALAVHATGLSLASSMKALLIFTTIAYMVGAYLFVRDIFGPAPGLAAAAVFGLSVFALREALLYGGNIPQYMAVALFPWLMWAIGRAASLHRWRHILATAIFYTAIILCHQFHALVISPVAIGYALVIWLSHRRQWKSLAAAGAGLGLGLGLSCFFWLPALLERQWTGATESAYLDINPIHLHFLSLRELTALPRALDQSAANPWLPFTLQPIVLLLVAFGILSIVRHHQNRKRLFAGIFWLAVLATTVFLLLPPSQPLWDNLPFLALAQFPWRLLGMTALALSVLAGAAVAFWPPTTPTEGATPLPPHQRHESTVTWLPAALAVVLVLLAAAPYLYPFLPFIHYGPTVADMTRYEVSTHNIGMTTLGEYVPKWVKEPPTTSPFVDDLVAGRQVDPFDPSSLPNGGAADLTRSRPNAYTYEIESQQPFTGRFRSFFFPGWQAAINGQSLPTYPEPETGFVTVSLPAGSYAVELTFTETPLRRASNAISIGALVIIMAVSISRVFASDRQRDVSASRYSAAWALRPAALVAVCLVAILAFKVLYVDRHTEWFRISSPPEQVLGVQHPLNVLFDDLFQLLGYDISSEAVPQGQRLEVVLYWQQSAEGGTENSTNYRTFVHLDSPVDKRTWAASDHAHPGDQVAQIDLPTSTWDTGRYVRDRHILWIPPDVPPTAFYLTAGIYNPESDSRLTIGDSGEDTFVLQPVEVRPGRGLRVEDIPTPMEYHLNDNILLLGYEWEAESAALTLFWRCKSVPDSPSVVFVHLLDDDGALAWGADAPPLGGLFPTTSWQPGRIVADPRVIELGNLPAGDYTIAAGMYDPANGERLQVQDAAGGTVPSGSIPLFQLKVD